MREIVLVTNNTADLPKDYLRDNGIVEATLTYVLDGVTYNEENCLNYKDFYAKMRGGAMPTTSQMNVVEARELYEPLIQRGHDILHIAFSSGLSGSYNSCCLAASELMEVYPEARIEVVDSLSASLGEGLLVYLVNEKMREVNLDLEELAQWTRSMIPHICHNFTVDDLNHLHRGGRVSKTTAVLGSLVGIKPILRVDGTGHLVAADKVRGRRKSLIDLVDRMEKQMKGCRNEIVFISHGDCIDDAAVVKKQIEERFGIKKFLINPMGPVIGTHAGPGTVALFFVGNER